MIDYLIDSTALWRMLRKKELADAWAEELESGSIGSCVPQRVEFRRSARNLAEFESMSAMFQDSHPEVSVPKTAWVWIDSAQFRLAAHGHHQALSVVDWLVCSAASHHGLVLLHDDRDFAAAARLLPDLRERNVHQIPKP